MMRTSRPVAEKLGAVRQDPELHGLLFTLINRATGGRQERAARACRHLTTGEGRGLTNHYQYWVHTSCVLASRWRAGSALGLSASLQEPIRSHSPDRSQKLLALLALLAVLSVAILWDSCPPAPHSRRQAPCAALKKPPEPPGGGSSRTYF